MDLSEHLDLIRFSMTIFYLCLHSSYMLYIIYMKIHSCVCECIHMYAHAHIEARSQGCHSSGTIHFLRQNLNDVGLATQARLRDPTSPRILPASASSMSELWMHINKSRFYRKDFIFIILIMCMYLCVPVCRCVPRMQWEWKPEEGIGPLRLGLEVGVSCLM